MDYPCLSTYKDTKYLGHIQGKIEVFSDKIGLSIDKYPEFVDKKRAPGWAPAGSTANQGGAITMKTHRGGGRGEQSARPASSYEVIFVLSFNSLDIL